MLTINEAATIRAALWFWIDEIVPNGPATAKAYFDRDAFELMTRTETERLVSRFDESQLRFAQIDQDQLLDRDEAVAASPSTSTATVIKANVGDW